LEVRPGRQYEAWHLTEFAFVDDLKAEGVSIAMASAVFNELFEAGVFGQYQTSEREIGPLGAHYRMENAMKADF